MGFKDSLTAALFPGSSPKEQTSRVRIEGPGLD